MTVAGTPERKFALTKVAAGDYLLPSNDGETIWRIRSYMDGPSFGLSDWSRDRQMWSVWRWTSETGPGCFVDTSDDEHRWEEVATTLDTRREAINYALTAPRPKTGKKR